MTIHIARRAAALLYAAFSASNRAYGARNGRVLLPANVCAVVPLALRAAGRQLAFVDIDPATLELDVDATLARLREGDCDGVVFVRPYGALRDADEVFAALRACAPQIVIVDDRCLCRPLLDAERCSPAVDLTLYSTGRGKYVDFGGGGYAFARDGFRFERSTAEDFDPAAEAAADACIRAAEQGERAFDALAEGWLDRRPPDVDWADYAARIERERARADGIKRELGAIYDDAMRAVALPPPLRTWRYNLRVAQPQALLERIFAAGLFASRHFAPVARRFGDATGYPAAEALHAQVVNLFDDRHFDAGRARRVAAIVAAHLASTV